MGFSLYIDAIIRAIGIDNGLNNDMVSVDHDTAWSDIKALQDEGKKVARKQKIIKG